MYTRLTWARVRVRVRVKVRVGVRDGSKMYTRLAWLGVGYG